MDSFVVDDAATVLGCRSDSGDFDAGAGDASQFARLCLDAKKHKQCLATVPLTALTTPVVLAGH